MLPDSSLSRAASGLRGQLLNNIDEIDDIDQIKIGHPADTLKDLEALDDNCLNLFFYDANHDGYPVDGTSDNPFYIRLHCLITAIGFKTSEPEAVGSSVMRDVSKGENELRLIGEVMRILHEQPVIFVEDVNNNRIAELQIVPHTMNLDNLNHVWSTQSDISYRLSVAYEMALAPVPLVLPSSSAPLVGDSQFVSWGAMSRAPEDETGGLIDTKPIVEYLEVDVAGADWAPHICLVEQSVQELHYVFKVAFADLATPIDILIAGQDNGQVKLLWNVWRRKTDNSVVAWQEDIADTELPLEKDIQDVTPSTEAFFPNRIDPDNIDARRIVQARLPSLIDPADTRSWQAVLYAVHEWNREEPEGSGVFVTTPIKSNTVLLYGDAS